MDSYKIHLWKTITWRIIASFTTMALAWAFTGSLEIGASVGIADAIVKTVLYFLHERIWHRNTN